MTDFRALCFELLEWAEFSTSHYYKKPDVIIRARTALAEDPVEPTPIPASARLPEPSVKVLAHYFNALGNGRTICAIWVPAKSRSDDGDLDENYFLEYDEDGDKYYWPEGWYEEIGNWEELGWAKVYEGEIAYWQPLPQWPASALPARQWSRAEAASLINDLEAQ